MLVANKKRSKPTPREQRRIRRDKVREEEKDRKIEQKQAKKRERKEEVDSIKGRVESKAAAFVSHKPKMRVIIPIYDVMSCYQLVVYVLVEYVMFASVKGLSLKFEPCKE
nr:hypothetical protein [Tanacetum cinerariifolium]